MPDALEALRFRFAPSGIRLPDLPPALSDAPSVVAMSLPKAGSTLLFALLQDLAPQAGLAYVSLQDFFFINGLRLTEQPHEAGTLFRPRGYCYGGFRGPPPYAIPILGAARCVVLVRDPRDMAVSHWYSITQSHVVPKAEQGEHFMAKARSQALERGKDAHVLQAARGLDAQYDRLLGSGIMHGSQTAVFRYEDVIFRKREWVEAICAWFGWAIPQEARDRIADRHDVRPARPDPSAHIRQVAPGNHREELGEKQRAQIDRILARWLTMFGYA
ncbi:sulfotransferase domain-containing protein [Roseomonas rosulenta]|uniref:sulfotransferase domain-containing protein n=1 Tax=Roseomonas rosulenta TaxID=2748667 RepID=UPI0018E0234E|nr:sulfotransferase domain-containing protein [Roseomonas rosulenta]